MNKFFYSLLAGCIFAASAVHANWVCNINDVKDHQYTFSAPQEDDAEKIAETVCKVFKISQKDCTPDCFDTGVNTHRWHCSVQNQKRESWSFTTPTPEKAKELAMNVCKSHQIMQKDCNPACTPE